MNPPARSRAVEIVRAGPLTTVQDLGRPGYAHLGVGRSGALDQPAHRLANRLVGNPPAAATLETTLGGTALRVLGEPVVVAVCGAVAAVRVNGAPVAWAAPVYLPTGALLEIGPAVRGVRSYVAIAGGFLAEQILGSRSTDLLSGLGPAPLRDGDVLVVGSPPPMPPAADVIPVSAPADSSIELAVLPGPRVEHFGAEAWRTLTRAEYRVKDQSNRIALRLDGPALARQGPDSIPSEGAILGALQVPADGLPILFLADHPPTGGYPVIGVIPGEALHLAAQAAPGTRVRFRAANLGSPKATRLR
jgi:biotin-dependent carboxylase-like uncharacterized protein